MDFWMQRLKKNPEDVVAKASLAGLYSTRFKTAGDINDIHTSDSLYLVANRLFKTNSSSLYRSLATNCITQHKFLQAQLYLDTALSMGDDLYLTYLMRCDVAMELGDLYMAEQALKHIAAKNNFDYLIREAKILDHKGDLDDAIKKMEAATQKAVESKKDVLFLWAKSNLADMYGHANRYKESYQCYLDVLEKKPDYLYALKGIAWLAFSYDKNMAEAKRIVNYLAALHPVPDYDLLLIEIASYENDSSAAKNLQTRFITTVSDSRYGDMYNKYAFYLMIDENKDFTKALQIAQKEVSNRPTSQSYDLLAWTYYKMGRKEEAFKIAKSFVENRNYEPDALYHLGVIYAHAGELKKAKQFMREAESSAFELGPQLHAEVHSVLRSIEN
jgi:tetratricopeptide (TPR) repeat protein